MSMGIRSFEEPQTDAAILGMLQLAAELHGAIVFAVN